MSTEELFKYMDHDDWVTPLPHAFYVDQAILTEESKLVVMRFGSNDDIEVLAQDECLRKIAPNLRQWCAFYRVDNRPKTKDRPWCVPDFNQMYELYDRITVMFFFRNKHMMCDLGTGNNNKINFLLEDKDKMTQILEKVYRGAVKGKGLVEGGGDLDFSTRMAY